MSKGIARIVLKEGYSSKRENDRKNVKEKSGLQRLNQLEKLVIEGNFFYTKNIKSVSELEEPLPLWAKGQDCYCEIKWSS